MPRCCSAGSREAIIHMELAPGTYKLWGCAMPSWPTAQELHPANAYCFCSSSPRSIPLGHHRSWLWNKGCPLLSHPQNHSWAGEVWREAQEESWDRQGKIFTGVPRREDSAYAELSMVFLEEKAKMSCQLQVLPTQVPMVFHYLDAKEKSWGPQLFRKHVTSLHVHLTLFEKAPWNQLHTGPAGLALGASLFHLQNCLATRVQVASSDTQEPWNRAQPHKVKPSSLGLTISHTTIPSSAIGIYLIEQQQPGQLQP